MIDAQKYFQGGVVESSNGVRNGKAYFSISLPSLLGDLRSIVRSPSGVRGKGLAENIFGIL